MSRKLAPHVQAAIAMAAQPKTAGVAGSRVMAAHVHRAIAAVQPKTEGEATGGVMGAYLGARALQLRSLGLGKTIQRAKGGGEGEKNKGDDYANNVQKLVDDLNEILPGEFVDAAIQAALTEINDNRWKCAVATSHVKGADTNTAKYGRLKAAIVNAFTELSKLIGESDMEYFRNQARSLCPKATDLIRQLPATAVDQRVARVIQAGIEGDSAAMAQIDGALKDLADALERRLQEYLRLLFERQYPSKKGPKPSGPGPGGGTGGAGIAAS